MRKVMNQARIVRAERRLTIARLVKTGLTYRQIHRALQLATPTPQQLAAGVTLPPAPSLGTIHNDVKAVALQIEAEAQELMLRARATDLVRLDEIAGKHYDLARNGDADSARVFMAAIDRKGKMIHGYFIPTRIEHSGDAEAPVVVRHESGIGLDLAQLTDEDLEALDMLLAKQDAPPEIE